jgi:universal stress protein E
MSQYQRLLLIADPSMRHYQALQRAVALAEASGAALHIAAFVDSLPVFDQNLAPVPRESLLDKRRQWLQAETAALVSKGIQVTIEVLFSDDPLAEILLHVEQMQPDMLIKDVQQESVLKRAFITPLDCHLLRQCPVPVHLLSSLGHAMPRRVLAAVDLGTAPAVQEGINDQIIRAANGLAVQCDAELHLLHAYDLSAAYLWDGAGIGGTAWSAELVDELRSTQLQAFIALADRYGVPADCRHFIIGPPSSAIGAFALSSQADVLVLGSVQHHGLDKLLGSTSEYLLYQAPCNILAVKPRPASV